MNFVKIKGYSKYVINKNGVIKNVNTNNILEGGIGNSGYKQYRLTDDNGITLTWGIHRLLAWVFLAKFKDITGLVINHKDGDKLNNDLTNLEIVTYQENAEHAGINGLTTKCKPVSIRHVLTGKVLYFPSIKSLAKHVGLSKDVVGLRCCKGEKVIQVDYHQYKFGHDEFTFIPTNNKIELLFNTGRRKPVIVRNVYTLECFEFDRSSDAAEFLNCSIAAISEWLRNSEQPIIKGFYQIQPLKDMVPWIDHSDIITRFEKDNRVRCVYTWDKDNNLTLHHSARDAAKFLNITTTSLDYRLKSKGLTKFKDGTKCAYYSDWSPLLEIGFG